jgi:sulfate transport system ATP-binding protein
VIGERVAELLDLVQLSGFETRYPAQLSGGQRQRVALARALAIDPQVLLLDEPFGALDARVRKDLRRWLREFHRKTGLTTIFVTHDQDEAMELADRVAVLNEGRIEQVGTPDELYDHPASPFVMSFIGETVAVDVVTSGGIARVGGQRIEAAGAARDGHSRLYLRPHEIKITAPQTGTLVGRIENIRRTASGYRVEVSIDNLATPIDINVTEAHVKLGDRIGLMLAAKSLVHEDLERA